MRACIPSRCPWVQVIRSSANAAIWQPAGLNVQSYPTAYMSSLRTASSACKQLLMRRALPPSLGIVIVVCARCLKCMYVQRRHCYASSRDLHLCSWSRLYLECTGQRYSSCLAEPCRIALSACMSSTTRHPFPPLLRSRPAALVCLLLSLLAFP